MLPADRPVWDAFLNKNPTLFERIYYDVLIGGVVATEPGLTQTEIDMFYHNTAKRIDALAELKDEVWIIEVADRPGLRATGQLLTYLALWLEDPKILKTTRAVLVCSAIDSDLEKAMVFHGVLVRHTL
jgi:hypothetical protein